MSETVAVVLSDLHLGSADSALSPRLAANAGRTYSAHLEEILFSKLRREIGRAQYLVLNGDTIDVSLQSCQQAFVEAGAFFRELSVAGLFDEIIYIPGNHDHQIWQLIQQQVMVIGPVAAGSSPRRFPQAQAGLLDLKSGRLSLPGAPDAYRNVFLRGLFQDGSGKRRPEMPISVVFPNLFVQLPSNRTNPILVTHGHFFCLPWVLMTEVFPRNLEVDKGLTLAQLEQINMPLTELGWTALGQAGPLTSLVQEIYKEGLAGQTNTLQRCLDELGDYLDETVFPYKARDPREWLSDAGIRSLKSIVSKIVAKAVRATGAHKGAQLFVDDEANIARINRYIGLSRAQYSDLFQDTEVGLPSALIFGHTHIPIRPDHNGSVTVRRFGTTYQVRTYNSGGFVADADGAGSVAMAIDADGAVRGVRIWQPASRGAESQSVNDVEAADELMSA